MSVNLFLSFILFWSASAVSVALADSDCENNFFLSRASDSCLLISAEHNNGQCVIEAQCTDKDGIGQYAVIGVDLDDVVSLNDCDGLLIAGHCDSVEWVE